MAILVTGGAGYIGSVAVDCRPSWGAKVVVLDNLVRGHCQALDAEVPFHRGDVDGQALVTRIAREHELESCVHLGAFAQVDESAQDPNLYLEDTQ